MPYAPPNNESTDLHGVAHMMRNYFGLGRKTQLRSHTSHGAWAFPLPPGPGQLQPYLELHSKVNPTAQYHQAWIIATRVRTSGWADIPPAQYNRAWVVAARVCTSGWADRLISMYLENYVW